VLLGTLAGETGGAAVLGINEGNIDGELNIDGMLLDTMVGETLGVAARN